MDYTEQIQRLEQLNQKDEERIQKLQASVRDRKAKIAALQDSKLLHSVKTLSADGVDIQELIQTIENKDADKLLSFMVEQEETVISTEESVKTDSSYLFQTIERENDDA